MTGARTLVAIANPRIIGAGYPEIIGTDAYTVAAGTNTRNTVTMGASNSASIGFTIELEHPRPDESTLKPALPIPRNCK